MREYKTQQNESRLSFHTELYVKRYNSFYQIVLKFIIFTDCLNAFFLLETNSALDATSDGFLQQVGTCPLKENSRTANIIWGG